MAAAAGEEYTVEHDKFSNDAFEEAWNALFSEPEDPLFEKQNEAEPDETVQDPQLEDRVDTLEYRLERALLCLNQCQRDLSNLRKEHRSLSQKQGRCQARQDRQHKLLRGLLYAIGVIFLVGLACGFAPEGWQLLHLLSQHLDAEPDQGAGMLVMAVILLLVVKLVRAVVRALNSHFKEADRNAVSDR